MREALVRATGRRESASDPAFAALVAQASDYVKSYGTGPRGEAQVVFDGAALERAIVAAGRSVWDRSGPSRSSSCIRRLRGPPKMRRGLTSKESP